MVHGGQRQTCAGACLKGPAVTRVTRRSRLPPVPLVGNSTGRTEYSEGPGQQVTLSQRRRSHPALYSTRPVGQPATMPFLLMMRLAFKQMDVRGPEAPGHITWEARMLQCEILLDNVSTAGFPYVAEG